MLAECEARDSIAYERAEALGVGINLKCTRKILRLSDNIQIRKHFMKRTMGLKLCLQYKALSIYVKETNSLSNITFSISE